MAVVPEFSATFVNDGGPLIVLPRELLPCWEGGDKPTDGRIIETEWDFRAPDFAGTDYARACSARDPVDVLEVGDGRGIAVGGPEGMADESVVKWLRLPGCPGEVLAIHVNCNHLEVTCTHPELGDAIAQTSAADWEPLEQTLRVEGAELVLMHAAFNGRNPLRFIEADMVCIGDAIAWEVGAGTYTVEYRDVSLPGDVEFRLIRLRPA
jgi:hypothetical protein